jgi:hypothetical protein
MFALGAPSRSKNSSLCSDAVHIKAEKKFDSVVSLDRPMASKAGSVQTREIEEMYDTTTSPLKQDSRIVPVDEKNKKEQQNESRSKHNDGCWRE